MKLEFAGANRPLVIKRDGKLIELKPNKFAIGGHQDDSCKLFTKQQININTNDASQLRHPYISFQLSKMIVTYHTTHGDYKDIADIKKLPLVNGDLYAKLAPYLTVK